MGGAGVSAAITFVGKLFTTTATGWAAVGAAVKAAAFTFLVSKAASEFSKEGSDRAQFGQGRTQTVRQEAAPRQIIYGEARIGGIYTFMRTSDDNRYLHMVITLSGHEVENIGDVYFDDDIVQADGGDISSTFRGERESDDYSVTGGQFVRSWNGLPVDGSAFSIGTIINVSGFTNDANNGDHRITDIVEDETENEVRITVETTLVDESSKSVTMRSDYVHISKHLGATDQTADTGLVRLIDDWTTDHRQRECAKIYLRIRWNRDKWPTGIPNPSAVIKGKNDIYDPRSDSTGYSTNPALCIADFLTWERYGFGADYDTEISESELIASANVCDESVSLAGGGTETRYTINGAISSGSKIAPNLNAMQGSMAGETIWSGGQWYILAGYYRTPEVTFDESDLTGGLSVITGISRSDLFNSIKGTYVSPDNRYIEAGFPAVTNSTYVTNDGGEKSWENIELPFTDSPSMAQRIAKIQLEQVRQQITVSMPVNLKGLRVKAGDVVKVTNARMGWTEKPFEVTDWELALDSPDENPIFGVNLELRETASGVYDWNSGEETTVDLAPDTSLPDATSVQEPQNVTVKSGTDQLYRKKDGTVVTRIRIDYDPSPDSFVDHYIVQYRRSSDTEWQGGGKPEDDDTHWYIWDVEDDVDYDVRIRAVNPFLVRSDWVTVTNHTVVGKTEPPPDVASFTAQQNRELVTFKWSRVAVSDLSGYEIRYKSPGLYQWDSANLVTRETRGTLVTNAAIPPGEWIVGIKSIDTSGNYSVNDKTSLINVINEFDLIEETVEHPDWLGVIETYVTGEITDESGATITDESGDPLQAEAPTAVVHQVSGTLVPNSKSTAEGNDFNVFDSFVYDPVDELRYTAREVDITFDEKVRSWADIEASLGPGETGSADPDFYLDYRTEAGSYDGFEVWAIGTAEGRYFKGQVRLPTDDGVGYVEQFKVTTDLIERQERFDDFAVADTGTTLTYNESFHTKPNVKIQASEGTYFPIFRNKTTTDVDIELYDASGTQVAGTVDVTVTGV